MTSLQLPHRELLNVDEAAKRYMLHRASLEVPEPHRATIMEEAWGPTHEVMASLSASSGLFSK